MTGWLEGKVAVVTGAAQGLGLVYTHALTEAGAAVVAVDEQVEVAASGAALCLMGDVAQRDDVERMVAAAAAGLGGIDVLVNNAGRWQPTPIDASRADTLAGWHELFDTNTRGAFLMGRAVVPYLIERGGGHIVNVTSADVLAPRPSGATDATASTASTVAMTDVFAATKWALNGFTQAWALALRPHGIRVNAIAMGLVDTPGGRAMVAAGERGDEEPAWLAPEEQARLLLDLLAEGPDGRTGETIGSWPGEPVELPARRARGDAIV